MTRLSARDLREIAAERGIQLRVVMRGSREMILRLPPFELSLDKRTRKAALRFARIDIASAPATPENIARMYDQAMSSLDEGFNPVTFHEHLVETLRQTGQSHPEFRDFLKHTPLSKLELAYGVMKLQQAQMLSQNGVRLGLGVATGTTGYQKDRVIYFENPHGLGEYKLTIYMQKDRENSMDGYNNHCPHCGAPPGYGCIAASGKPRQNAHAKRGGRARPNGPNALTKPKLYSQLIYDLRSLGLGVLGEHFQSNTLKSCSGTAPAVMKALSELGHVVTNYGGGRPEYRRRAGHFDLAVNTADQGWVSIDPTFMQFHVKYGRDYRGEREADSVFDPLMVYFQSILDDPINAFEIIPLEEGRTPYIGEIAPPLSASQGKSWVEYFQNQEQYLKWMLADPTGGGMYPVLFARWRSRKKPRQNAYAKRGGARRNASAPRGHAKQGISEFDTAHPAYRAEMMLKYPHSGVGVDGWEEKFAHLTDRAVKETARGKPSPRKRPIPKPWRVQGRQVSPDVVRASVLAAGKTGMYGVHGALAMIEPMSAWTWYRTTVDPEDERLWLAGGGGHEDPRTLNYGITRGYAERIQAGEKPPPLLIVSTFMTWLNRWDPSLAHPGLLVLDGNHRVGAAKLAGIGELDAWVGVGGQLTNPGHAGV